MTPPDLPAQILALRASGLTWTAIGRTVGKHGDTCRAIARNVGLAPRMSVPQAEPPSGPRMPLPPGATWGVLVAGTCLEGVAYPGGRGL